MFGDRNVDRSKLHYLAPFPPEGIRRPQGNERSWFRRRFALAINFLSVSDLDYGDCSLIVFDGVQYAVSPLPQSIAIVAGKFFAPLRTRIHLKRLDVTKNFPKILLRDAVEVSLSRVFE
jgi:hypothetical protein